MVLQLNDDSFSHTQLSSDNTQFEFIKLVQHNSRYVVWDNTAWSSRMDEVDCVNLVVPRPTEVIINPIAQQLSFDTIKGHHATGSEHVWPAEVIAASCMVLV